jgi:PAS domain S-box-containing protein
MQAKMRRTAISAVGDVPWGTHFCQFYQTKEDLLDILVPYFKAGLEDNEFCMWVTSEPLRVDEAKKALGQEVRDLDAYIAGGQLEILDYTQWYTKSGRFDCEEVLKSWVKKEKQALKKGFYGLRLTGNTFWLERKDWKDFTEYEAAVNSVIGKRGMLAVCTYSLDRCNASEIIDVVSNHEFALIRRGHNWEIIESAKHRQTLEALRESEEKLRLAFENAVDAIFWADPDTGLITNCNQAAETLLEKKRREIIGRHQTTIHPPQEEAFYRDLFKEHARSGGTFTGDTEVITKSGQVKPVSITASVTSARGRKIIQGIFRDVTERKQAEQDITHQKELLENTLESLPHPFYVIDPNDYTIKMANSATRAYGSLSETSTCYGLTHKAGTPCRGTEHPCPLQEVLKTKKPVTVEHVHRDKHGDAKDIEVHAYPVFDSHGNLTQVIEYCFDVSERKRVEQALRQSEAQLRIAVESLPFDFFIVDQDGNYVMQNSTCREHWGDITGRRPEDIAGNPDTAALWKRNNERAFAGEIVDEDVSFGVKGDKRYYRNIVSPIYEGNQVQSILGINIDTTERRRAAYALRAEKEFTETALNAQTDTFFVFEPSTGRAVRWNKAFSRISGYSDDQIRSMKAPDSYYSEEDLKKAKAATERILKGEPASVELSLITKDGRAIPTEYTASLIRDDEGNPKYIIAVGRDITERRRAAEAIQESEHKYRAIFEGAADAIILVDPQTGMLIDFNDRTCQMLGYRRQELEKLPLAELDIVESAEQVAAHAEKILREGSDTFQTKHKTRDGRIRDILANCRAISIGGRELILSILRDITEQKQTQEQVQSLAKFPSEDPNPVLRISGDGTILYANEPSAPVLQTWQRHVGERLPEGCVERVYQAVSSHKALTFEFECTNGRIFLVTLAPSADGSYANAYGVDITERKAAERELSIRNQIDNIFLTCPDEHMYAEVLELVLEALESEYGTFGYLDQDGHFVVPAMTREIYWEKCNVPQKDIIFERGQFSGIWGQAMEERKTLYSNTGPFNTPAGHIPIENTMVTPIVYKDELISAIHIANKPGGYDEKDKALLEMMADYIAPVLYARLQRDRHEAEREQAEQALRKSEAALAEAQRIARTGNWEWDVQSGKVSWSDEVFRIFGVQPQEPSYELAKALTHPDDTAFWERCVKEALQKDKPFTLDYRAVRPDGSVIWIHNEAEIIRDEQGRPLKIFGTAQDVTERKQAEQALRESEEKFRNLAEQSPNMIFINRDGRIAYANSRCEEAMGYTREEFYSPDFDFMSLIAPESRDLIRESYRRHLNGEDVGPVEYVLITKKGNRIHGILTTKLIQYEGESAILGTVTDITERKRTEEALQESERELSIRNRVQGIFLTTKDDEMYAEVLRVLLEAMESEYGIFGYIDEHEALIVPSMTRDVWERCRIADKTTVFPRDKWGGIWGRALIEKKTLCANEGLHVPKGHVPITRVLVVPIMYGGEVVGVFEVANKPTDYSEKDQAFLERIAAHVAPILNARLQRDRQEKERKEAEEALRRSEQRHRSLIETMNEGLVVTDADYVFSYVNDKFCDMLGYKKYEVLKHHLIEFIDADYKEFMKDQMVRRKRGEAKNYEIGWRAKNGRTVYTLIAPATLFDEHGSFTGSFGVLTDISERKEAETRQQLVGRVLEFLNQTGEVADVIRDVLALIKDATGLPAVGIRLRQGDDFPYFEVNGFSDDFVRTEKFLCARDESGSIIYGSDGKAVLECMCGCVLSGRTNPSLSLFTDYGSFWTNSTTKLLKSDLAAATDLRIRGRCNQAGYESVALIPLRAGAEIVGLLQLNDTWPGRFTLEMIQFFEGIGDSIGIALSRIRAEEALRHSEQRYSLAQRAANIGSWDWNILTGELIWSEQIEPMFGFDKGQFAGTYRGFLDCVDPHDRQFVQDSVDASVERGEDYAIEHRVIRPDGTARWVSETGDVIRDENGGAVRMLGIVQDITERKKAEEDLDRYRKRLEELVQARTVELTDANKMLRQEIEERKRLEREILDISEQERRRIGQELHDSVGQQLTGIAFMTKVLEQKLAAKLPEQVGDVVEISQLVRQATDQARALAKGLHPVDLDAESLMAALQELAANTQNLFGISCTFKCERPVPVCDTAVAINLYRIAQEAVTNAMKHGRARNIEIELANTGPACSLTIRNDGLDFPSAQPYSAGMGLKIMRHRVEMINATLDIRRGCEGGAVVTCTFPNTRQ